MYNSMEISDYWKENVFNLLQQASKDRYLSIRVS